MLGFLQPPHSEKEPEKMGSSTFKNTVIAVLAALPSIFFYLSFLNHHHQGSSSPLWSWCYHHPFLLANALFFLNLDVLFWIFSLIQSSHWMIDLYWMVIPLLLVHFYATHPLAQFNLWRSRIVTLLTWVWSLRLTHTYLRRERWQLGVKEDWRFTDMRHRHGKNWWWISFFAVYVSQQLLITGVCLPLYIIHTIEKPLSIWDLVPIAICLCGPVIAYHADTQLYKFVTRNKKLKQLGEPVVPILDKGLWQYSRHPNYFGEQLWWWGLAIFAWNLGYGWALIGALMNSICLAYVAVLVEERMLKHDHRAKAYREYQKTTSAWIPWFKSSSTEGKDKAT